MMKKIPESFELNEDDIKEAIAYWLNNHEDYGTDVDFDFTVTLKSEERRVPPPGGHRGGMSDDVVMTVFSAVAVKDE
jgi:hypothetical protein